MPCSPHTTVLLRHGETEWSRDGRHTGSSDIPLTETGRRQALAARPALAGWRFDLVLTSPMRRARETAELVGLGSVARVREDLSEWDYGLMEGRTTPQIQQERPGWLLWRDGVAGGESLDQVGERADRILAEIAEVDGDVCLVAHGHILRILAARAVGLPPVEGSRLALNTATISLLGDEHGIPCILRWNDGSHLRAIDAVP